MQGKDLPIRMVTAPARLISWEGLLFWSRGAAWALCLACLLPAVVRLCRGRGRYLDPIWGVIALLSLNRLSYWTGASDAFSNASATFLAVAMAGFAVWFQRHDA